MCDMLMPPPTRGYEERKNIRIEKIVTPNTLLYTFDHSCSRGLGSINPRSNCEGAAPSAATPQASARGAVVVDTKHPPLAERNHPRAVTILQSPNRSNID